MTSALDLPRAVADIHQVMSEMNQDESDCNRRAFITGALLGVAGGSLAGPGEAAAAEKEGEATVDIKGLYPEDAPAADVGYSPGIVAQGRKVVVVSGQGPRDLDADMETQMRQTFERIDLVLKAAGGSLKNVILLRSYFVNIARDLPVYRKVRKEYLSKPYPASTAVGVPALAIPRLQIEIEAVAVL
jgi:enamine deaminase RidA (YjgF/YER057c/UK114 family)